MLSKNKIKFIRSLQTKKARDAERCFIAEGDRIVNEIIQSNYKIIEIIALPDWIDENKIFIKYIPTTAVTKDELQTISNLSTAQRVLAIIQFQETVLNISELSKQLIIGLDKIQDPGNMGTIIRLANWFGIENIICSQDCVDIYNPKVVQATMGAISKVKIHYVDFIQTLKEYASMTNNPIYGTFLDGNNIYATKVSTAGIVIFGNEGNGISKETENVVTSKLTIPSFNKTEVVESLNVSIAASIICSEFRRR
jgi:RNA methyltransferase, TrmH family